MKNPVSAITEEKKTQHCVEKPNILSRGVPFCCLKSSVS